MLDNTMRCWQHYMSGAEFSHFFLHITHHQAMEHTIWAAAQASINITLMGAAGTLMVRLGLLDKHVAKGISRLLASFLLPCMLFVSIAPNMSWQNLVSYWLLPVSLFMYNGIGLAFGALVAVIAKVDRDMYRFLAATCSSGNTASLPLALVQSLAGVVAQMSADLQYEPLQDGKPVADTADFALNRGVAYVFIVTVFSSLTLWTVLYRMLAPPASYVAPFDEQTVPLHASDEHGAVELKELASVHEQAPTTVEIQLLVSSQRTIDDTSNGADNELDLHSSTSELSLLAADQDSSTSNNNNNNNDDDDDDDNNNDNSHVVQVQVESEEAHATAMTCTATLATKVLHTIKAIARSIEVPAWAAITSVALGLITPARHLLFETTYFKFLLDALTSFGDSVVPLTLLTLGAAMSDGPKPTPKLNVTTIVLVLIVRLFIIPWFGIALLYMLRFVSLVPPGLLLLLLLHEYDGL
jgi:predicted permease